MPRGFNRCLRVTRSIPITVAAVAFTLNVPKAPAAVMTAYSVPAGVVGAAGGTLSYTLGMQFDVVEPIRVTSLGAFDSGSDGVFGSGESPVRVAIFDRITQLAVTPVVSFSTSDPGEAEGGARFKELDLPVTLPIGFQGLIVADGYSGTSAPSLERFGNITNQSQQWSFEGGLYLQASTVVQFASKPLGPPLELTYPTTIFNSASTAAFAAGNFQFTAVPEPIAMLDFAGLGLIGVALFRMGRRE